MSARADRRSPLRVLLSDPWRKLAAIGLAVLLWHYLDDQITDSVTFELALEAVDSASHPGDREALHVTVDSALYFVAGFFDRASGEEISSVSVTLSGAKHLIQSLDENPGYRTVPALDALTRAKESVDFSIQDVRTILPKFEGLLSSMEPASVRIDLIQNARHDLPLNPGLLQLNAPRDVEPRLRRDSAEFSTKAVSLLGPADQIESLQSLTRVFSVDVGNPMPGEAVVRGTLRLLQDPRIDKIRFAEHEPITVTVPLKVAFQKYVFRVPYILDCEALPEDMRNKFRATETSAEIEIEISHTLDTALTPLNDRDRRDWIRRYARLWVRLPHNAIESDTYTPEFLIVGKQYQPGLDYRVFDLKPLRVERIP